MNSSSTLNKWIEIHLEAIENNLNEIRRRLSEDTRLIAVLKADAYGLGAGEIAHVLSLNGVDFFAVTFLNEALDLRARGREEDILIFAPLSPAEARAAVEKNCILTVGCLEDLDTAEKAAKRVGQPARVHIKADTGLGRFGTSWDETLETIQTAAASAFVMVEGIYTHFSEAAGRSIAKQFKIFEDLLDEIEGLNIRIPMRHCCSSSSYLKYPHMHMDAVRIGTLIGGQFPAGGFARNMTLENPLRFKARVLAVRYLEKGSLIGCSSSYRLRKDTRVAVVAAGSADGIGVVALAKPNGWRDLVRTIANNFAMFFDLNRRATSGKFNGQRVYIRGGAFLQLCQVEVPPGVIVKTGDEIELPLKRTLASRAIPRIYCRNGQPGKIEHLTTRISYSSGEE